jgi:prepilin-type N-terminal cleavage/methylation domain-containing protein
MSCRLTAAASAAGARAWLRLRRAAAVQDGFTLAEMLVVVLILGVVLAGLTQLFMSATKSQSDQTNRVNAQQDARVALDQLRREIHCGSSLVYNSVSSVTITLPSYCPSSPTTALSANVTLPNATIPVVSTSRFNSPGNTISFGASGTVTCTGRTATSFTGCSGGTAATYISGAKVTSPVTWCATTSGQPYSLKRYAANFSIAGAACTGSTGAVSTSWLVSSSIFSSYTRSAGVVAAPTFTLATAGGTIPPGAYTYDVTAVTSNGEFSGAPAQTTVPTGSTNRLTLSWSAYTDSLGAAATSYRIYGRDNGSTTSLGLRLLGTVTAPTTSYTDTGPAITTLSSNVTLPAGTIPVADTAKFTSPYTIAFGASGTITCAGPNTATSFVGCTGGVVGTYPSGTSVFQVLTAATPAAAAPPLATLNVSVIVDQTPADTAQRFTLKDAISLRNSGRF